MGLNIIRISPFSSSITATTTTTTKTLLPKFPSTSFTSSLTSPTKYSIPTCLNNSKFDSFTSKPHNHPIFSTGFGKQLHQHHKKNLKFSTMASAPGSVQKSEDEWRAVLSPEQFRILRQKGTE
ncbi:Peptide methionine sulfoxide reductase B3 [Bienertia sinuspersici]